MAVVDIEAIRARRIAIEQEIERHHEAIAALEAKRNELEIGERVITEFASEQGDDPSSHARERSTNKPKTPTSKPEGLPTVPEMIFEALRVAHGQGKRGLEPAGLTSYIRDKY